MKPIRRVVAYCLASFICSQALAQQPVVVMVNAEMPERHTMKPYSGTWDQKLLVSGDWQSSGIIKESLERDDEQWRHVQIMGDPAGRHSRVERRLNPDSSPQEMVQHLVQYPEGQPKSIRAQFESKSIKRQVTLPDDSVIDSEVTLPFDGYDGFIFGLTLSTLPLKEDTVFRIPAVMANFMNGYWVDVTVRDGGTITLPDGSERGVWLADAQWLNLHDGDTYPGGPNGSGGQYTLFKESQAGEPAVYRYRTDTVDIILQ